MLYWNNGDEERYENTSFCWNKAKDLIHFINTKGIEAKCYLFDFSAEKNFDDAIHIPLNDKYYQRSKKINYALNYPENNSDIFSIIDSDCYFHKSYYNNLIEDIHLSFNNNFVLTYQLFDIDRQRRHQYIDFKNNIEKFYDFNINNFGRRHYVGFGTMGGFFICSSKKLKEIGGFNEKFLTWGIEDDEALSRLKRLQCWWPMKDRGPIHLGHKKDLNDKFYYIPTHAKEFYEINNVNYGRNLK